MAKIRISEGKSKLACILPSVSIFGKAKDTIYFQKIPHEAFPYKAIR